jgi:hypothetical protein
MKLVRNAVVLTLFSLLLTSVAEAAVRTVSSSSPSYERLMSDPLSWEGGVVPVEGDSIVVPVSAKLVNDLPAGTVFRSIRCTWACAIEGNSFGLLDGAEAEGILEFAQPLVMGIETDFTLQEPATLRSLGPNTLVRVDSAIYFAGNSLTLDGEDWVWLYGELIGPGQLIVGSGGSKLVSSPSHFEGGVTIEGGGLTIASAEFTGPVTLVDGAFAMNSGARTGVLEASGGRISIATGSTGSNALHVFGTCAGIHSGPGVTWNVLLSAPATQGSIASEGPVDLGSATLQLTNFDIRPTGTEFVIIENDGNDPIIGTFASLPEGAFVQAGSSNIPMRITYAGGDGNDVAFRSYESSTTSVAVSPAQFTGGDAVTITANVAGSGATGTVTFLADATPIGSASVVNGLAVLSNVVIPVGTQTITARYEGNDTFGPSSGSVSRPLPIATTTAVGVTPAPSKVGESVTVTATVTGSGATGTVTFLSDATLLGSAPLVNGVAVLSTSAIPFGTHAINAHYEGDQNFTQSSGSMSHAVLATTSVTLDVTPETIVIGVPLQMTAEVTSSSGIPQGSVSFYDGADLYQTVPLDAFGRATTQIIFRDGPHTLRAVYSGSSQYTASTSSDVVVSTARRRRRAVG